MLKETETSVVFLERLPWKADLTQRASTNSALCRGAQPENKDLYYIRKLYALSVTQKQGFALPKRSKKNSEFVNYTGKNKKIVEKKEEEQCPYLGIGWNLRQEIIPALHPTSKPLTSPPPLPKSNSVLIPKAAIPIKSFVLNRDTQPHEPFLATWTQSDFYKSAVALLTNTHRDKEVSSVKSEEVSVSVPSPVNENTQEKQGLFANFQKKERKTPRLNWTRSGYKLPIPRRITLAPKEMIRSSSMRGRDGKFKPQPRNPRLAAFKIRREKPGNMGMLPSLPVKNVQTVQAPISARSTAKGLAEFMVEMRPRDLPPHRIPVEFGLFRKVKRTR